MASMSSSLGRHENARVSETLEPWSTSATASVCRKDKFKSLGRRFSDSGMQAFEQQLQHMTHAKIRSASKEHWGQARRRLAVIVDSVVTDVAISVIILVHLGFSIFVTDAEAAGRAPVWMDVFMGCFVAVYCAEICLRIFVLRWNFFRSALNVFDLCVVAVDLIGIGLDIVSSGAMATDFAPTRIVRVVRLLRSARILVLVRSLYIYFNGMASAMAAVMWALIMISLALTMCSVFAVEVIQPYVLELADTTDAFDDCTRCLFAYSSVWHAYVTFFQNVVAGDSWGLIAVPVMDAHPWTGLFFIPSFLFIQLGLINMILAVIVDKASDAKETNSMLTMAMKEHERMNALREMEFMFASMDTDGNGELTIDEIFKGFDENHEFKSILTLMDIGKDDIKAVFNILDEDRSGTCTYSEFVEALWKMKSQSSHTLLVFIKSYLLDVRHSLEESITWFKNDLGIKLAELHSKNIITKDPRDVRVFNNLSSVSSASSSEPPPRHNEADAADMYQRITSEDVAHCGIRSISPASSRPPPPRHQEATATATRITGDAVVSTACLEAMALSLLKLLSNKPQEREYNLDTLSKLFEAPPTSVPAKPPAIAGTCSRQVQQRSETQPQQLRGTVPLRDDSSAQQQASTVSVQISSTPAVGSRPPVISRSSGHSAR